MENIDCIRACPECNKELEYSTKWERNRAIKENKICHSCRTKQLLKDPLHVLKLKQGINKYQLKYKESPIKRKLSNETKQKIRDNAKIMYGKDNPSYGKSYYRWWIEKYGKEIADEKMKTLNRIRSEKSTGKNNSMYGKPSPNGSGNGWSGWYNGWYFRSLLELSYMINVIEKNNSNWESGEQEKYRISYVNPMGVSRNYYSDFIVDNKFMVECKPTRLHNTPLIQSKTKAAIEFCKLNGLTYILICPKKLDVSEIKCYYDSNKIKFLERYDVKYKQLYKNI